MLKTPDEDSGGGSGRQGALEATKKFAPGTVGAVVHRAVSLPTRIFGDFASGTIGDHYREPKSQEIMGLEATAENLKRMAVRETGYWQKQGGLAGWVGSSMSASTRFGALTATKDNNLVSGLKARCDMQSGTGDTGK